MRLSRLAIGLVGLFSLTSAIQVDVTNNDSLLAAARICLTNMLTYYKGNQPGQIPGLLIPPWYWWEAGAMWGHLIQYWSITQDTTYNPIVLQAMQFQVGQNQDYNPANQSSAMGNDDQGFWALAALDAAELRFENPTEDGLSWLGLAQAVFNDQVNRWDANTCDGGLRWQVFYVNGYNYKNAISNGIFFQIAARLARYTGNATYGEWAEKSFNWMLDQPWMQRYDNGSLTYTVYDGSNITNSQCTQVTPLLWSYNVGTIIMGSAYMYAWSNDTKWETYATNFMQLGTWPFFSTSLGANTANDPPVVLTSNSNIMTENTCERATPQLCNQDQPSFKSFLSRWLAMTAVLVPSTREWVTEKLMASAQGAAGQCTGTVNGATNKCGRRWYQTTWDGYSGVGEDMSGFSVFQNTYWLHQTAALLNSTNGSGSGNSNGNGSASTPVTAGTGGNSTSHPGAGGDDATVIYPAVYTMEITTGDVTGAGILTVLGIALALGTVFWMVIE